MAGSSPAEAAKHFREPLQKALSCITDAVFVRSHDSSKPGGMRTIASPRGGEFIRLAGEHRLNLSVAIDYEIVQVDDVDRGPWKIKTRQYKYHIVTEDLAEILLYHWHPESRGRSFPHLHVGAALLTPQAVMSHHAHVPTGRVSLESVIRLLIDEFNVVPQRTDWAEVLDKSERDFVHWRTWH